MPADSGSPPEAAVNNLVETARGGQICSAGHYRKSLMQQYRQQQAAVAAVGAAAAAAGAPMTTAAVMAAAFAAVRPAESGYAADSESGFRRSEGDSEDTLRTDASDACSSCRMSDTASSSYRALTA